ncbi:MAG: type II toxin-antitoxin system VapC family toxin [Acidobacteriia bacterium]|nr:type II toxin-antitoxin system VapC family toxin [Terriglobia bacterium]
MALPIYFDTSVFLEIGAKRSKHAKNIKELLKELKAEKARIYTSILTVQEVSVLSYRRGQLARDDYGKISQFARIVGVTKDIALTAAKREAEIKDDAKASTGNDIEDNRRRKWDCFHIATAQHLGCPVLYTTDEKLMRRHGQLGLTDIRILAPRPAHPSLDFTAEKSSVVSPQTGIELQESNDKNQNSRKAS